MGFRNPTCGCQPCEAKLECHPVCRCVPEAICVSLSEPAGADCDCISPGDMRPAATVRLDWDENAQGYAGVLICGTELSIDLWFTFVAIGNHNYFCLESTCLGLVGSQKLCKPVTAQEQCLDPAFDFSVDLAGCVDYGCGQAMISTRKADRIELTPECDGCGCECLPRCLCVTLTEEEAISYVSKACWDEYTESWHSQMELPTGTFDIELFLTKNQYTGVCELVLQTGSAGDGAQEVSCPEVTAFWILQRPYEDAVLTVEPLGCPPCCNGSKECCPDDLPNTLKAELTFQSEGTANIVLTRSGDVWTGDVMMPCVPYEKLFILKVECIASYHDGYSEFKLTFGGECAQSHPANFGTAVSRRKPFELVYPIPLEDFCCFLDDGERLTGIDCVITE